MPDVARLVLTAVGDDRAGLVAALADVVADHDGNWEASQLAELAGTFAGVVVVTVPDDRAEAFTTALGELSGLLTITAHPGTAEDVPGSAERIRLNVLGDDRPGIVRQISRTLRHLGLSIEELHTQTRDAPMAGGLLFEAQVVAVLPATVDTAAVRTALEQLAGDIMVDINVQA